MVSLETALAAAHAAVLIGRQGNQQPADPAAVANACMRAATMRSSLPSAPSIMALPAVDDITDALC